MGLKSLVVMFVLAEIFAEGVAWSRSNDMQQVCANCHTMHNSQDGSAPLISSPDPLAGTNRVAQASLLNNSCYGCHSDAIAHVDTPIVLHFSTANYLATGTEQGHNTLAGGDFHWVSAGESLKGHNVGIIASQEARQPPGGSRWFDDSDPLVPPYQGPLACAGVNGCHGVLTVKNEVAAMNHTHHAVDSPQPRNGATLFTSYRWLNGIAGYEDPDCELTVSSADHNQYKGVARNADADEDTSSISHSCAGCHGDFHSGTGNLGVWDGGAFPFGNPWIRHPVDYEMSGLGGEYAGYGGGINDVATPVGRTDADVAPGGKSTVTGPGEAIVVCVSCHRAHGSPYDYSLRWDYKNWPDAGHNGCGDCHTTKN